MMKPNVLLSISAVFLGLLGLVNLFSPAMFMISLEPGASAMLIDEIRINASLLLGIAVMNWAARNSEASKARDAIFLGNTVGFGLATVLSILAALSIGQVVGWVMTAINLVFAVLFFLTGRANMSSKAG